MSVSQKSLSPFVSRHIGPRDYEIREMLALLGYDSLDHLTDTVVPNNIAYRNRLNLLAGVSEEQALTELKSIASKNQVLKSFIGQGYYGTHTPKVLLRNVLENPAWYTAYTPYQPEISQGRLEVLFYFQTMICELTGMEVAGASLLDEGTAAAEAMTLCRRSSKKTGNEFLVAKQCHPQTLAVLETRAEPLGIQIKLIDQTNNGIDMSSAFGILCQYPATDGTVSDLKSLCLDAKSSNTLAVLASDLLALTVLEPPSKIGADVVVGNAQRFGVPFGFGGPHAAFIATKDAYKRTLPGRLVGQSIDSHGNAAYRLALQTREQHIRREKATSNICTAQALLAIMSTLYACYHGPQGLPVIARRVHGLTQRLIRSLKSIGMKIPSEQVFDTFVVETGTKTQEIHQLARTAGFNLREFDASHVGVSLDETTTVEDLVAVMKVFGGTLLGEDAETSFLPASAFRDDEYLTQPVFHRYRSETEMMRYLRRLSEMDIALDRAMIPLGSCTMKLNAASEMTPVTWPEFNNIHPFAPPEQWTGYREMIDSLEAMLCEATGYDAISLQPNAGSQGEYAGLLAIKKYHESRGDHQRDICLIPSSAHGTNPASAQMANMQVVVVKCDDYGNVDVADLDAKIAANAGRVAAIMITYPSTHGVFEEVVTEVCDKVHAAGGQVYIDGANLNALVGVAKPGKFGGDVSHLNLHKTFCIPHGGGGPGVGPVAVRSHLAAFLPKDGVNSQRIGAAVSSAPYGSGSILPISWMYIRMMGAEGLRKATQVAILSANYIAHRLKKNYSILFTGHRGLVAHECIIDTRPLAEHHVTAEDIAKRLIDFGFHAPTMSFPVGGTLMIEPTESESLQELDRFVRAMTLIFEEYEKVRTGHWPADNNPLHNAPHTLDSILDDAALPYSRREAVCPDPEANFAVKYWPPVGRVDNVYGDRNLVCSCPPLESYESPNN